MMREICYEADVVSCVQADELRLPGAFASVEAQGFACRRGFERRGGDAVCVLWS